MMLKYLFTFTKQSLVRTIYHCKNKHYPAYLHIKSLLNPILSLYMITLRCFKLGINGEERASGKFSEKRDPTWSQTTSISDWDVAKNEENRATNNKYPHPNECMASSWDSSYWNTRDQNNTKLYSNDALVCVVLLVHEIRCTVFFLD